MITRNYRLPFGIWLAAWCIAGATSLAFDSQVQPTLRGWGTNLQVNAIARSWNELGSTFGIVIYLIIGLFGSMRDRGITAAKFAGCLCITGAMAQVAKHLIGRVRPNSLDGMTIFYGPFTWFRAVPDLRFDSMPSGHTAAAFAMATAISLRWPRGAPFCFVIALGVGICRTLTNSHFPSDVIWGALLGMLVSQNVYERIPGSTLGDGRAA